jgi:preprotein translocase subunit SecY
MLEANVDLEEYMAKPKKARMSTQTRANWLVDTAVFIGGVLATLSGVYFLFLPSGGYRGGRNPTYGIEILFSRHTWSDLHVWTGVVMIAAVTIHFAIHWSWVKMMGRRLIRAIGNGGTHMSRGAKMNVALDALVAVSFLICAVSGVYFLFAPGGVHSTAALGRDATFLFSRTAWDMLHTWSGVVLVAGGVVHFAIHWRWVKNVTRKFFRSLWPQPATERQPVPRSVPNPERGAIPGETSPAR